MITKTDQLPARGLMPPDDASLRRSGDPGDEDPFLKIDGMPPNAGEQVLPHVVTFQGLMRNVARTYYVSDEAMRHSWDNARFMRNDPGIMECLEQRQRSTALLDWHLEADDNKDKHQKFVVDKLTEILYRIPNFLKYRECLLHALWYGKYGVSHRFRNARVNGQNRVIIDRWMPVNGDKLVFRYDDGSGQQTFQEDQVGIRVGAGYTQGGTVARRWAVERVNKVAATDHGLAYFLEHWERPLLAIHKHMIEDAEWEAPERAGAIHGVGIRSRLYWSWFQKQETLAWLMEYLERSAFGMEIWSYPAGNPTAYEATRTAAEERIGLGRNIVLVPRHPDSDILSSDVKRIEPGMAGADVLDRIIREYFGHQIKRYILGQILTSEAASTGLGSGVASIHLDTYLQIIRYDSINLAETITTDLVQPLIDYNWPHYKDLPIKFVIETEAPDVEGKLSGWKQAYEMGLQLKSQDVYDLIGATVPQEGEDKLTNPQHMQADMQQQQMAQAQQQQTAQVQGWTPQSGPPQTLGQLGQAADQYQQQGLGRSEAIERVRELIRQARAQQQPQEDVSAEHYWRSPAGRERYAMPGGGVYDDSQHPRSPKPSGISLGGKFYPPGEWIPNSALAQASPAELAMLGPGAQQAAAKAREDPDAQKQQGDQEGPQGQPQAPGLAEGLQQLPALAEVPVSVDEQGEIRVGLGGKEIGVQVEHYAKPWKEEEHPRDHGKFAPKAGAQGEATPAKPGQGVYVEPGKRAHPPEGKLSIFHELNPYFDYKSGKLIRQALERQGYSPEEIEAKQELADKYNAGERWIDAPGSEAAKADAWTPEEEKLYQQYVDEMLVWKVDPLTLTREQWLAKHRSAGQRRAPAVETVTLGGRDYDVKEDGNTWFFRLKGHPEAGWTHASPETTTVIQQQLQQPPNPQPTPSVKRVRIRDREYRVKHDKGAWFFQLEGHEEAGWTHASPETAAVIQQQLKGTE